MSNSKIEPSVILTLTTNNIFNIPIIVTDITNNILTTTYVNRTNSNYHQIRMSLKQKIDELIQEYNVDTIILEQNQLFIDKIDKYPDPYVLRDIQLGFSIKVMIEDNYWELVKYILEIPKYEWKKEILNKKVEYAIDLYKKHIQLRPDLTEEFWKDCDNNNYYETLCLSECTSHTKFLNKKYQINK